MSSSALVCCDNRNTWDNRDYVLCNEWTCFNTCLHSILITLSNIMHQIANHWTFLITFTSQYKHFKVFSYIKCLLQQQRGVTRRCHIQTDIWGRGLKVCLALTCLFPTPLSVMFVLYCHTTRFEDLCWRAISTDIYKSYTQSCAEKGSNTHTTTRLQWCTYTR